MVDEQWAIDVCEEQKAKAEPITEQESVVTVRLELIVGMSVETSNTNR